MSALKGYILGIVSVVVAGVIVAFLTSKINAPESAAITVEYQTLKFPNFLPAMPLKDIPEIEGVWKRLGYNFPLGDVLRNFRYSKFYLISISVKNTGNIRSKNVEISVSDAVFLFSSGKPQPEIKYAKGAPQTIESLNPGDAVELFAIVESYFRAPSVLALHDGKKLGTISRTLDDFDDPLGASVLIANFPFLSYVLFGLGIIFSFLIIFALIFGLFFSKNIALRAKWMSASDAKIYSQIIEYIRANLPEKLK
jgi:hypothetical protein